MQEKQRTGSHTVSVALYEERVKDKRLRTEEKGWSVLNEDEIVDPNINIADQAESQVTIQTILQKLSPRQRQVVEMRYLDGLTHEEIGQSLSLSRERIRQIDKTSMDTLKRSNNW